MIFLLSLIAGLLLGLLGGGGAIFMVPILKHVGGFSVGQAIAGSLLVIGIGAFVGAIRQYRLKNLRVKPGILFACGSMPGAMIGTRIGSWMGAELQMTVFAVVVLISALSMLYGKKDESHKPPHGILRLLSISLFTGIMTGAIGVGGGFLIVPALIRGYRLNIREASATSLLVISLSALSGMISHPDILNVPQVIYTVLLFVLAGVMTGIQISKFIPASSLQKGFAWFLLGLGFVLVIGG
ncbi:MAG: sulfite exporter TauE/SafE family protein [Candidatus Cloacimonetes bacterium]|nr:sulfite exporter TauE/SafE family protein [Candidatus Cloacimonadota bacterium]